MALAIVQERLDGAVIVGARVDPEIGFGQSKLLGGLGQTDVNTEVREARLDVFELCRRSRAA